jgi:hypothetical protein
MGVARPPGTDSRPALELVPTDWPVSATIPETPVRVPVLVLVPVDAPTSEMLPPVGPGLAVPETTAMSSNQYEAFAIGARNTPCAIVANDVAAPDANPEAVALFAAPGSAVSSIDDGHIQMLHDPAVPAPAVNVHASRTHWFSGTAFDVTVPTAVFPLVDP